MGNDFRNAYFAPCKAKYDGTGQTIGLMEFQSYNKPDIAAYINQSGIAGVTLNTFTYSAPFASSVAGDQAEAPVDIELAHAMAPGAQIVVYVSPQGNVSYGPFGGINFTDDMLHDMAHPPSGVSRPNQNGYSYVGGDSDDATFQNLAAIASLGGSFFGSAGDGGAKRATRSTSASRQCHCRWRHEPRGLRQWNAAE